ncbi:MAG: hypothetical protein EHM90_05285, partial [Chloroflexi bacterium]
MARRPRPRSALALLAVLVLASACQTDSPSPGSSASPGTSAGAGGSPGGSPAAGLAISEALRSAVGAEAIRDHLDELFAAANAGDGTRASGLEGYAGSQEYVVEVLTEAGYEVTLDEFQFPFFAETAEPRVSIVGGETFAGGEHLRALIFSRSGEFEAPIVTVGTDEEGGVTGSGGCERADWNDFPTGAIALAGAGPCFRLQMVEQAQDAGAAALIISSPDYEPGAVRRPTLLDPDAVEIPALYASNEAGAALLETASAGGSVQLS